MKIVLYVNTQRVICRTWRGVMRAIRATDMVSIRRGDYAVIAYVNILRPISR